MNKSRVILLYFSVLVIFIYINNTRDMNNDFSAFQSAAKPYYKDNNMEGSETIPEGSTQCESSSISDNHCGSASPITHNGDGDEIVRNKYFIKFIEDANVKFNYKFDYSKFEYTKMKGKSTIICPIHGEFTQSPMDHLRSVYGCPSCSLENEERFKKSGKKGVPNEKKYLSKQCIADRLHSKYGDALTFDLDSHKWVGRGTTIRCHCEKHGWFEKPAYMLILKNCTYGCNQCAQEKKIEHKTQSKDIVFAELQKIWNGKYVYTKETLDAYTNKRSRVPIICPEHGVFYKTIQKHMVQGCPKCTMVRLKELELLPGGYCEDLFVSRPDLKDKDAFLYYLKINNGKYYKIGITATSVKQRIKGLVSKAKSLGIALKVEVICEKSMTLYKAFKLEQSILKTYNKLRDFHQEWSTEIFKVDIFDFIKDVFVEHIPTLTLRETL